jgi:anti-anti-sigma factor
MDFIIRHQKDVFIVNVTFTRATLNEASELKQILNKAIDEGFKKIVIDLQTVEYIDSTFVGVLVVILKKLNEENGKMRLVGFYPAVHTIVEKTKLHRTFEIFESTDEALQNL